MRFFTDKPLELQETYKLLK